jgi:hypothetical protein
MRNRMFIALVLVVVAPAAAQAQSPADTPAASAETRKMCREAVLKICDPGWPPNRNAVRRCAAKNLDKLPPDCALLLADSAKTPQ